MLERSVFRRAAGTRAGGAYHDGAELAGWINGRTIPRTGAACVLHQVFVSLLQKRRHRFGRIRVTLSVSRPPVALVLLERGAEWQACDGCRLRRMPVAVITLSGWPLTQPEDRYPGGARQRRPGIKLELNYLHNKVAGDEQEGTGNRFIAQPQTATNARLPLKIVRVTRLA